jgi:hypothetical protein
MNKRYEGFLQLPFSSFFCMPRYNDRKPFWKRGPKLRALTLPYKPSTLHLKETLYLYSCKIRSFFGWITYKTWTEQSSRMENSYTTFFFHFSVGRVFMIPKPSEKGPKF